MLGQGLEPEQDPPRSALGRAHALVGVSPVRQRARADRGSQLILPDKSRKTNQGVSLSLSFTSGRPSQPPTL